MIYPTVGERWRDKDPRMENRVVTITQINVDGMWIEYGVMVLGDIRRKNRSNLQRFMKAFEKLP